ncbi:myeloid leukemia factor 1 [Exaiptasia diaphana]|uniref:Myeloid leukemia factor 1 n=1 Tax=Exaiptasia diaphana TaxID=2652724 RepID=A0A913XT80_EXADI|nr:myeloid leukemia factor 1 [Exaiptasia diaphana]
MFGFGFRPFEEDPFFREHHDRMRQTFGAFDNIDRFFGRGAFALGAPPRDDRHREPQGGRDRDVAPRDLQGGMFGMNSMFRDMEEQFARAANNPNTYSYSQSSVMSYSNDGSGEPKYFQAHHSTKNAPGGIKETRNAIRDSESGVHRMAVGHHIGDRGHVIERSMNKRTGEEERKQDFINLDEGHAQTFNQEWSRRTRNIDPHSLHERRRNRQRALEDLSDHRRGRPRDRPAEHAHERRIRHQHRPSNKHAPREGLE